MKHRKTPLAVAVGIVGLGLAPWHVASAQSMTDEEIRDVLGLFIDAAAPSAEPQPTSAEPPPGPSASTGTPPDEDTAVQPAADIGAAEPPQAPSPAEETAASPAGQAAAIVIPPVAEEPRGNIVPRRTPFDEGDRLPPAVAMENKVHIPRGKSKAEAAGTAPPRADPPESDAPEPPPAADAPRRGLLGFLAGWLRSAPASRSGMAGAFREAGDMDWDAPPCSAHADRVLADLQRVRATGVALQPHALPETRAAETAPRSRPAPAPATLTRSERVLDDLRTVLERHAAPASRPAPQATLAGTAVDEARLDGVRGGFDAGNGLQVSFGIDRAVYVNGTLVTTTNFNVVQIGGGNTVTTNAMSQAALAQVVQNSLDGQKIQGVTVINASANSLSVLRSMNLQSTLRGAAIDSLRR
jgi:hypothetical protein